jgi:Rha family phage regulatory protein
MRVRFERPEERIEFKLGLYRLLVRVVSHPLSVQVSVKPFFGAVKMQELMSSEVKTMSSVDIARLTGKQHKNVMRDVKSLIDQEAITQLKTELSEYKDASGKSNPMYNLDYEATMVLITGYDAKRRSMVIKRWIALEKGEAVFAVSMKKEELELRLIAGKYAAEMEMVSVQSASTFIRLSYSS